MFVDLNLTLTVFGGIRHLRADNTALLLRLLVDALGWRKTW